MKKLLFVAKQFLKMFLQAVVLPLYYMIYRRRSVDKKLVIFADAHNKTMPYSMKQLHDKFTCNGYRTVDMFSDYGRDSFWVTAKNMFKFMKLYAVAGYVVICDYFLPVSAAKKRSETTVIQLWHACGIFKRFAYEAPDDIPKFYMCKVIKNYDIVTVSSKECISVYARAMRLPEKKVMALGVSRTDEYFSEDYIDDCRTCFYESYPQAIGKKIALWAPTFRGNAAIPYLEGKEEILKLREQLSDEWFILVRLHPHFHDKEINCSIPTERLLPVIDLLISDYSTVIFEYSLFNKPLVLFAPDYYEYGRRRGFYIDYESLPGRIVTDKGRLPEEIVKEYAEFDREKMLKFKERYMSACDGSATSRIYNILVDKY